MGVVPAGEEANAEVTAVRVWSNVAVPVMVTVPDRVGVAAAVLISSLRTAIPALWLLFDAERAHT